MGLIVSPNLAPKLLPARSKLTGTAKAIAKKAWAEPVVADFAATLGAPANIQPIYAQAVFDRVFPNLVPFYSPVCSHRLR
jgi:hypothetical protein